MSDENSFPIVCPNGCPEGHQGQHKFSCEWAGLEGPRFPEVTVPLFGQDGNIYYIIGQVRDALRRAGHGDHCDYFSRHIMDAGSADEALQRVMRWVKVT